MNKSLDELRSDLLRISPAHPSSKPPQWLSRLLERVPGLPTDVLPHRRSAHADLQGAIAAASFHPAIEACLHLINVSKVLFGFQIHADKKRRATDTLRSPLVCLAIALGGVGRLVLCAFLGAQSTGRQQILGLVARRTTQAGG